MSHKDREDSTMNELTERKTVYKHDHEDSSQ